MCDADGYSVAEEDVIKVTVMEMMGQMIVMVMMVVTVGELVMMVPMVMKR